MPIGEERSKMDGRKIDLRDFNQSVAEAYRVAKPDLRFPGCGLDCNSTGVDLARGYMLATKTARSPDNLWLCHCASPNRVRNSRRDSATQRKRINSAAPPRPNPPVSAPL